MKRLPITIFWLVICGVVTWTHPAARAQETADPLAVFSPAAWPPDRELTDVEATPVTVDLDVLDAITPGQALRLTLSPTLELIGTTDRIEKRAERRYSVFGRYADDPDGFFILVVEEDVAVGLFQAPAYAESYRLAYVGDGVHKLTPLHRVDFPECKTTAGGRRFDTDPDALPPIEDPREPVFEDSGERGEADIAACNAPRRHFDVLVFYTPAARTEAGGTNAIRAESQLAVDTSNQTYVDSQISPRMVLVERFEINYNETSDVETDRNRLTDTNDGYMDSVHSTRNTYGADFVVLLVDSSDPDSCGIAYCLPSGSAEGFCVVQRDCASGNFSFPHEVGHLQGCAHNLADAGSGCNAYCDSYGHRFFGGSGTGWRTVMSYNNASSSYTRIGKFSNPNVTHDGIATGYACGTLTPGAYNASTVNSTTVGREDWRNPKFEVWVDFGQAGPWEGTFQVPWPTMALGVGAVYGGTSTPYTLPVLHVKSGSTTETITINKRVRIEACGGTVRIGG